MTFRYCAPRTTARKGLRKAFSAQRAEQESSTSEIAALDGWDNLKQVET